MLIFLLAALLASLHMNMPTTVSQSDAAGQSALINRLLESRLFGNAVVGPLPPLPRSAWSRPASAITASSGIVLDAGSGTVLWHRESDTVGTIASLTKLMTALIFLETDTDLDQEITIESSDNANVVGSRLYVQPGETMLVRDIFFSSLVGSANNATKALARSTGLSEEEFVARMNRRASLLGLKQTVFYDVTGLDPRNQSTVSEYALVARQAFRNTLIIEALGKPEYVFSTINRHNTHHIKNTDNLLSDGDVSVIAGKTGYLNEAGFTFACQVEQEGHDIIIVLFHSIGSGARFQEAKLLAQWTWQNYWWPAG